MWKRGMFTTCFLLSVVAGKAVGDLITRSDVALTVVTDEASQETYVRVTLPQLNLEQTAAVAYAEVSFNSTIPVGTNLELWKPSSTGSLPWLVGPVADRIPVSRFAAMQQGAVRIDVTQLARLWSIDSGREFLVRVAPGQGVRPLVQSDLSNFHLSYHKVRRQ